MNRRIPLRHTCRCNNPRCNVPIAPYTITNTR